MYFEYFKMYEIICSFLRFEAQGLKPPIHRRDRTPTHDQGSSMQLLRRAEEWLKFTRWRAFVGSRSRRRKRAKLRILSY